MWLIQFSDLISLMLTFFVLLYAMSHPAPVMGGQTTQRNAQAPASASDPDSVLDGVDQMRNVGALPTEGGFNLAYLGALIETRLDQSRGAGEVTLDRDHDRLIVNLPGDLLFASNSADLAPEGRAALRLLAPILDQGGNRLTVGGHTDPVPVSGPPYGSNWALSLARAETVARVLMEAGYTRSIDRVGYADTVFQERLELAATRPDLPAPDISHSGARRVALVIARPTPERTR